MPNVLPPAAFAGIPSITFLRAGTPLFRVHQKRFAADSFNSVPSHRYYGGGRFDGTDDDPYPFMYAGETVDVAVSETLLRDLHPDDLGIRKLPRPRIAGRRISAVKVTASLDLVDLRSGINLGAVAQDTWLTTSDPRDYAQTRHWGHWVRSIAPAAAGYIWRSKRDPTLNSFVLFGDRTPAGAIAAASHPDIPAGPRADFDTPQGIGDLRARLTRYHVALSRR